jgi:hypothetical protein
MVRLDHISPGIIRWTPIRFSVRSLDFSGAIKSIFLWDPITFLGVRSDANIGKREKRFSTSSAQRAT